MSGLVFNHTQGEREAAASEAGRESKRESVEGESRGKNNGTILCFALRVHYESRRKAPNTRRSSRVLFRLGCHNTKVEGTSRVDFTSN